MDLISALVVLFLGFLGSFIGAIAGSGGMLTIPALIFAGLPANVAIATNKFGTIGLSLGAMTKYLRKGLVQWQITVPLIAISIVGAFIGAQILLAVEPSSLDRFTGITILLLLPFLFFDKDKGLKSRGVSTSSKVMGYWLYFFLTIYSGFFGAGSGTLMIYVMIFFFGMSILELNATTILPTCVLSVATFIIYAYYGIVDYTYGAILFVGTIAGGYFGARTAVKKGNAWIKFVFALIVLLAAIKLIFL